MSDNTNDTFDNILVQIAQEIYGRDVVDALGKALKFNSADTGRYNDANAQQGGTHMGTLDMLRRWRRKQKMAEERGKLKAALVEANLGNLADRYLPTDQLGHVTATSSLQGSSSSSGRQEEYEQVQPDGKGYYKQKMKQAQPSRDQLDPNTSYKMNVIPKGRMFIMNITERRKGSEVDVQNIVHVFREIGYEIKLHWNLTADALEEELDEFVNSPRNEGKCSTVFLLMAHGNKSGIKCFDDKIVTTKNVKEKVYGMKSMDGKPKMIFYQCCRGEDSEQVESDQTESDLAVTAKSDVLIVHATTEEHFAYRNVDNGSWFIQMLCEVLLEKAHNSDLSSMLEEVTGKVGEMSWKKDRQFPVVIKQGISKKIYFLPKYPPKDGSASA